MKIYDYDPITGELGNPQGRNARPDPLENPDGNEDGIFLLPRFATFEPPQKAKKNEAIIRENNKWIKKKDFRNENYWYKQTKEKVIFEIGQEPDNLMTDQEPIGYDFWVIFDEISQKWIEDVEKLKEMKSIELASQKQNEIIKNKLDPLDVQIAIIKGDTQKQDEYKNKYDIIHSEYNKKIDELAKTNDIVKIKALKLEFPK